MVDLVEMKAWYGTRTTRMPSGRVLEVTPDLAQQVGLTNPGDIKLLTKVEQYRTELVDTCLEMDDEAMEAYIGDAKIPSAATLRECLRKGNPALQVQPGAVRLLVQEQGRAAGAGCRGRHYLPAPTDVSAINTVDADGNPNGERKCSDDEPFSALAFKVINDAYGALTFVRGVLRRARQGCLGAEHHPRQARKDRPHGRNVRQGSQSL